MPRTIAYRAGGFTNCGISYTKFSQEELAEMKDRVMTESEASVKLEVIRAGLLSGTDVKVVSSEENIKTIDAAIDAIEEIQQYRAIGTPEECQKSIAVCKAMIDRKIAPENMEEYMKFEDECVKNGFTFDSLLKAREKQTAKKIVRRKATDEDTESELRDFITQKGMIYRCPTCWCYIAVDEMKSCWECGQKLDWSDEE